MKYEDGTDIEPGDLVQIGTSWSGRVIASMDTNRYLPDEEDWSYLGAGIMIDTDFGGLVYYPPDSVEKFVLIRRELATQP